MVLQLALAIIGSGALTTFITWLLNRADKKSNKNDATTKGLQQLLYLIIKSKCLEYIEKEEISTEDLEDLERAWSVYHNDLNGNGYLDNLMARVRNLTLK